MGNTYNTILIRDILSTKDKYLSFHLLTCFLIFATTDFQALTPSYSLPHVDLRYMKGICIST